MQPSESATVFHITRCSMHDGAGIRTVVFLKGCTMHCQWCHNPEGLSRAPQLWFYPERCIGCGRCAVICPQGAHDCRNGSHVIDRKHCISCGKCADVCPSGALEICGRDMTADAVMDIIRRDSRYYSRSGGGVTFSGGECLLWPEFLKSVMQKCREEEIPVTVETALNVPWENIEAVTQYTDTFFCDLKHPDSSIHKAVTGVDNLLILENLRRLSKFHPRIIIRVPLIPGINDADSYLRATAEIVNTLPGARGIELLRYNNLAQGKGKAIGRTVRIFGQPQDAQTMDAKKNVVREVLASDKKIF